MRAYRAAWVLPIASEPVRDGVVVVEDGLVLAVGEADRVLPGLSAGEVVELGDRIVLPGLVNAHTHLALTGEAGRHPRGEGLIPWLSSLVPAARALDDATVREATRRGLEESWRLGTDLVGDIVSHPAAVAAHEEHAALAARLFFEFLGVREEPARRSLVAACAQAEALLSRHPASGAPRLRPGLSPHAPWSVWPALWGEAARFAADRGLPWTTHVAESPEERGFLLDGGGALRGYLERLGVWDGTFPAPGAGGVALLEREDLLDEHALLVHGVDLDAAEIARLAAGDAALCLCPRSNAWLGLPPPPVRSLVEQGVFLCLGTDSLASNEDLGVWGELRAAARLAPGVPASLLVRMATAQGAMALGFQCSAGILHPGRPARLIAVGTGGGAPADPCTFLVTEPVESAVERLDPR